VSSQPKLSKGAREIKELAQTVKHKGLLVVARCYSVPLGRGERFEVLLEGDGQRAVVDIPAEAQRDLAERIAVAIDMFAAAIQLHIGASARGAHDVWK